MFYSFELLSLQNNGRFAVAWLAATRGVTSVKQKVILKLDIEKLADDLMRLIVTNSQRPAERLSLRLSAQLVSGIIKLLASQTNSLFNDVTNMKCNVRTLAQKKRRRVKGTGEGKVQKDQVRLEGDESFDEFYQSIVLSFDEFVRQFPKEPPGITMIEEYPQSIPTEHHSFQSPGKKRVNFNEEEEAEMSSIIRENVSEPVLKPPAMSLEAQKQLGEPTMVPIIEPIAELCVEPNVEPRVEPLQAEQIQISTVLPHQRGATYLVKHSAKTKQALIRRNMSYRLPIEILWPRSSSNIFQEKPLLEDTRRHEDVKNKSMLMRKQKRPEILSSSVPSLQCFEADMPTPIVPFLQTFAADTIREESVPTRKERSNIEPVPEIQIGEEPMRIIARGKATEPVAPSKKREQDKKRILLIVKNWNFDERELKFGDLVALPINRLNAANAFGILLELQAEWYLCLHTAPQSLSITHVTKGTKFRH